MGRSEAFTGNVIFHENLEHNYPRAYWTCPYCQEDWVVLGSRGEETCPDCDRPLERRDDVLTDPLCSDDASGLVE